MGVPAKVLALIVLAGAVTGLISTAASMLALYENDALALVIERSGGGYVLQVAVSLVFLFAAIALSIVVLIAPTGARDGS